MLASSRLGVCLILRPALDMQGRGLQHDLKVGNRETEVSCERPDRLAGRHVQRQRQRLKCMHGPEPPNRMTEEIPLSTKIIITGIVNITLARKAMACQL